jgi:hypothetical protein
MANTLDTFKEISIADVSNRPSSALTADESTKANSIITSFFTYFKAEHS